MVSPRAAAGTTTMAESPESFVPTLVDTRPGLEALADRLRGHRALGIDTEFIPERVSGPRLEIVQIASPDGEIAIVDYRGMPPADHDALAPILADPSILKVFHAGDQDLEMLQEQTGVWAAPIWDTQLVTGLFGYSGRLGYTAVVETLLGKTPKSGESMTDWSRRPLAPAQLVYAAEDVRYLIALEALERERLAALGRVGWAEEECEELRGRAQATAARRGDPETAHQRVKGWQKLRPRGLAILRELAAWRDQEARRRERPAGTVIRDDLLVEIARRVPSSVDDLRTLRGIAPGLLERHGAPLIAAVVAGQQVPASALPDPAPRGVELSDTEEALMSLIHALLHVTVGEKGVSRALVTNSAEVQRVAVAAARGQPLEGLRLLSGWRGEVVGRELRDLLEGRRRLSWNPRGRTLRLEEP
jgi:ribonuclease D